MNDERLWPRVEEASHLARAWGRRQSMAATWRAEPERGRPWRFLKMGARIEHDDDDR
jgi:hypothetical protein